jgi:hypothetical protein
MTAVSLNGRSFTDLLALQPGIVPVTTQQPDSIVMAGASVAIAPSGTLNAGNQSIAGQREDANGFMVNGGDVKELMNGGTTVVPNLDSIAEFRIITNNYDAEPIPNWTRRSERPGFCSSEPGTLASLQPGRVSPNPRARPMGGDPLLGVVVRRSDNGSIHRLLPSEMLTQPPTDALERPSRPCWSSDHQTPRRPTTGGREKPAQADRAGGSPHNGLILS